MQNQKDYEGLYFSPCLSLQKLLVYYKDTVLKHDHDNGAIPQGQTKDSITLAAHCEHLQ